VIERIELLLLPLLACGFFAVLFLQSGLDKVFDRKGNLEWMAPHFENSPFGGKVPFFLTVLTLFEVAAGLLAVAGALDLLFGWELGLARWALGWCGFTLLCLFAGQRLAKDYAGAASLAGYFAVCLIGLFAA
jgi:uncharacterized membrane protein YphA (DoxX/SURF4 family)